MRRNYRCLAGIALLLTASLVAPVMAAADPVAKVSVLRGSAARVTADGTRFALTRGEPRRHELETDSGGLARREFCGACGAHLFGSSSPEMIGIRASSLDDPSWYAPDADVWVDSAQPWDCMDPSVPKFGKSRSRR